MQGIENIRSLVLSTIDNRKDWLINIAKEILLTPELGFKEFQTSRLVSEIFRELDIPHETGLAHTGVKGELKTGREGPAVAIIGELDSLRVLDHPYSNPQTGAAHACGHHCQIAMLLGVATALSSLEILSSLSGKVVFFAVPAEEFIDVQHRWELYKNGKLGLMSGKQELIRLGAFDDIDLAMMTHTSSTFSKSSFSINSTSNGHLVKYIKFIGKASHAGSSAHRGVNALQAAIVALGAINVQRETFKDEDSIRLHGILTSGGVSANSTPAEVTYEGRVRGANMESISDANRKMDRSIKAGALAMGAKAKIVTIPGYLPIINNEGLTEMFARNVETLVGKGNFLRQPKAQSQGGSTDMGDLSQIMPAIHPYTSGAVGMGHGADYLIKDYEQAVVMPAKVMAMTVLDLLSNNASKAKEIIDENPPRMTKSQYLDLQNRRISEESYEEN